MPRPVASCLKVSKRDKGPFAISARRQVSGKRLGRPKFVLNIAVESINNLLRRILIGIIEVAVLVSRKDNKYDLGRDKCNRQKNHENNRTHNIPVVMERERATDVSDDEYTMVEMRSHS
jgi:hypothetical protein